MIISRTPFRVSFFGGGTDYPAWYREHGGAVLAASVDKYCYITCRRLPPFFEHSYRLVYSKIENCHTVDEIAHPLVRETVRHLRFEGGLEIHHDADLPARCGMGSSSSFTVGLLNGLYAIKGQMPSAKQLAMEAIHIEQELVRDVVGSQDQVLAAHGGLDHVAFLPDGAVSVTPVVLPPERADEFERSTMMFYTGISRTAAEIARTYLDDIEAKKSQLRISRDLVEEGLGILGSGADLTAFGELLHEGWQVERALSDRTTNAEVDAIYARARKAGAIGGKLTGAGGGGFMLLFVPPERRGAVKQALSDLIHVPFRIEPTGSQIIFFDAGEDYSAAEAERARGPRRVFRELSEIEAEQNRR